MSNDMLCKDNLLCCDDNCQACANRIYVDYQKLKEELQFTRKFIHEHGLEFALASQFKKRGM